MKPTLLLLGGCVCLFWASAAPAATMQLLAERFDQGSAATRGWQSASGILEEWLGPAGAAIRDLKTTYDADLQPATPQVPIPGGLEVLSNQSPNSVWIDLVLPDNVNTAQPGILTLYTANRLYLGNGGHQVANGIAALNPSTQQTLPLTQTVTMLNSGDDKATAWTYRQYNVNLTSVHAGEAIRLRFSEDASAPASAAKGLQIADITFSVSLMPVPEPASLGLLGLGAMGLLLGRRPRR